MPFERWLYMCRARWQRFMHRRRIDRDLDDEIQLHLARETEHNVARGSSRAEAERAARLRLGNPQLIREDARAVWSWQWLDDMVRDVRVSARRLLKDRTFSATVMLTLALCIGANTAVFSVVNAILIQPLPYPQSDALVVVWPRLAGRDFNASSTRSMFFTYREENTVFESVGLWGTGTATVTGAGDPDRVSTLLVTHGVLDAVAVPPLKGRWFSAEDDRPGSPETAILTYGYWQRRFNRADDLIGRTIIVDATPRVVVGIMPRDFRFLGSDADLILPQRFDRDTTFLNSFSGTTVARLRPGVTRAQAKADVDRMLSLWLTAWPLLPGADPASRDVWRMTGVVEPLKREVVGDLDGVLWLVMGTVGVVLLIGCANVANLALVRTEGRHQELAVRAALGAGWSRIARALVCESVVLATAGGVLGLGVAHVVLRSLVASGPDGLPRVEEIGVDPTVLAFTAVVTLGAGVVFGLLPIAKHPGPAPGRALHAGGRALTQSRDRQRARSALVVAQVALAIVLLVGAGLLIRSAVALRTVQPGFVRADEVQLFRLSIPEARLEDGERVIRAFHDIRDRVRVIPGVTHVAFSSFAPLAGNEMNGLTAADAREMPPGYRLFYFKYVSPGVFETLGTPVVAGRDFTWSDLYQPQDVAVVSEQMAADVWGSPALALGKRIRVENRHLWREVVGVVGDVHDNGIDEPVAPTVYRPAFGRERTSLDPETVVTGGVRTVDFMVRSRRTGEVGFLNEVRDAIWAVDSTLPVFQTRTLDDLYERSLARRSFVLVMLAASAGLALVLGVVGIYGVIAYAAAQRSREMGIRLALGAPVGALKRMFVCKGLILTAVGVGCGLAVAAGLTRAMTALLFGISPLDPTTYVAVGFVLAAAAAVASYLPARRAAAVDPSLVLRSE